MWLKFAALPLAVILLALLPSPRPATQELPAALMRTATINGIPRTPGIKIAAYDDTREIASKLTPVLLIATGHRASPSWSFTAARGNRYVR